MLGLFCSFWMASLSSPVVALVFHMTGGASRVFRVFGRLLFSPEPSSQSTALSQTNSHAVCLVQTCWCGGHGLELLGFFGS